MDTMSRHQREHTSELMFREGPVRKTVHFEETISSSVPATASISLLTSPALSLPLIAEKPGVRFQLAILLLGLLIALIVGFILSLLLVTQFLNASTRTTLPRRYFLPSAEQTTLIKNSRLFEHLPAPWIDQLNFASDVCGNFYSFVCQKWLTAHPLPSLDFKRSWFTERSRDIRNRFAEKLANLSTIEAENHLKEAAKNDSMEESEAEMDDAVGLLSAQNELEQFYSFHPDDQSDGDDDSSHRVVKRQIHSTSNNSSQSISNMLLFYHQCLHTSEPDLRGQVQQLARDQFWYTKHDQITSSAQLQYLFQQMLDHPLMRIWNMNIINLGTQTIIHIQRQSQDHHSLASIHRRMDQATLFEDYVRKRGIDLCPRSARASSLAATLKEYSELLISSQPSSNSSVSDDLHDLISNQTSLPILRSSARRPNDLRDLIQYMFDRGIISTLNQSIVEDLFSNFSRDLDRHLSHAPIFRSTISHQCQLLVHYYLRFRSLNESSIQSWLDYITSSIFRLIVHSWPGDASYTCLYTTIVRHHQLENITYWNSFLQYARNQIQTHTSPLITVEIRLVDFFHLDSIFRFLFADRFAHYCNLIIYQYGAKLLPFVSIFYQDMQMSWRSLWQQTVLEHLHEDRVFPSHRIPTDCLSLLEYYYPFALSSFYEAAISNQTEELYSIAFELRELLINNEENTSNIQYFSSLEFHIKPEPLKLYQDLASTLQIPYEYYPLGDHYLSTALNMIAPSDDKLLQLTHELFEINGYHTIEQGIFLQPTIAELYSNDSTRTVALLLIAHELGHAFCPCGYNLTEREYFADLIALPLISNYYERQWNRSLTSNETSLFFLTYGQSECAHINRQMTNRERHSIDLHIQRVIQANERFQLHFNCSIEQEQKTKQLRRLLPDLCAACRKQRELA